MSTNAAIVSAVEQVRIQLSTQDADLELPEKTGAILVPTNFRRYALSTLVNKILESPKPVPFEFIINGSFLRTTIDEYLNENGISGETTLEVEYVRALMPPAYKASFEHDDWVSSVDVLSNTSPAGVWSGHHIHSGHERILSGSYDGLLRVWSMSAKVLATSTLPAQDGRNPSVLAAKFISPSSIVSTGHDTRLRLWKYTDDESLSTSPSLIPEMDLYGHRTAVTSLAVHAPSHHILSASLDSTAALWSSSPSSPSTPPAPPHLLPSSSSSSSSTKRRKLLSNSLPTFGPLATLTGHNAPVHAAIFSPTDSTVAYTASSDRHLSTWDLTTATCVATRTPLPHTGLTSLCALHTLNLLAIGTYQRSVVLVDPREGDAAAVRSVVLTLKGHTNTVVDVKEQPGSGWGLVSASHDGTCRVWDVRNTRGATATDDGSGLGMAGRTAQATYRIPREGKPGCESMAGGEGVKVFSVCWDGDVGIVSGGEDRRVQINKAEGIRARM